jgi:serine/threonine protein phosphatase 1
MLTYAIGDIHGCLGKLQTLLAQCLTHARGRPSLFVFLGDYIDRGPDSAGVIEALIEWQSTAPQTIFLSGNHEELALDATTCREGEFDWLANGGDATLRSYGISSARELPKRHLTWLKSLRLHHDDGRRFFVHAGVDPMRPLNNQNRGDLLWIREPFLSSVRDFGRLIVHGHTPLFDNPDSRANRLNIDTGAVYGGPLTVAVFSNHATEPIQFIQQFD